MHSLWGPFIILWYLSRQVTSFSLFSESASARIPQNSLFSHLITSPATRLRPTATTSLRASSSPNNNNNSKDNNLLQSLEESFNYPGRLPSKLQQQHDDGSSNSSISQHHCGFCSIIGPANVGKSTLLNALLEQDLCVATHRPQTTRHAILGVLTTTHAQLCLVDTPGVIPNPSYKLQEGMMEAVMSAFVSADVLLVVTDIFSTPIPNDDLFQRVQQSRKPVLVAINKVDLVDKVNADTAANPNKEGRTLSIEEAVAKWRSLLPEALVILPLSALEGMSNAGVVALRKILLGDSDIPAALRDLGRPIWGMFRTNSKTITDQQARSLLPVSPPLYDAETLTDRSERFFASEIIRASLFRNLKREVPYCCEVRVTEFKEPHPDMAAAKQVVRMKATVFVERDSQKAIVIGKGGELIKKVGIDARKELQEFFGTKVHLQLNVKVDKDWRKNEGRLRQLGYLK